MKSALACICMLLICCSAAISPAPAPGPSAEAGLYSVALSASGNTVTATVTSSDGTRPSGTVQMQFTDAAGKVVTEDAPVGARAGAAPTSSGVPTPSFGPMTVTFNFPNGLQTVGTQNNGFIVVGVFLPGSVGTVAAPPNNAVSSPPLTVHLDSNGNVSKSGPSNGAPAMSPTAP